MNHLQCLKIAVDKECNTWSPLYMINISDGCEASIDR